MSQFFTPISVWVAGKQPNDDRGHVTFFRRDSEYDDKLTPNLWPSRSGFSVDGNWYLNGLGTVDEPDWFNDPSTEDSGSASTYTITGIVKDSNGVGVSGATLECYTTADRVKRGSCTTLFDGTYIMPSLLNSAHYIRAYKVGGAFNYGGTSDENLTPS
jgi:hypothetical protein